MIKNTTTKIKESSPKIDIKTKGGDWGTKIRKAILSINTVSIFLSIIIALLIGAAIVAAFNSNVRSASGYFFARPQDTFIAIGEVFYSFFDSLMVGAIYNPYGGDFISNIRPLTETMTLSVPLILAGLSVAVAFRAGLFNIGAQGQLIIGAICAGIVGFSVQLPYGLHLILAIIAAIIGGSLWGAIPGFLKAYTGAHEVVVTIMMNFIAIYFLAYCLHTKFFIGSGQTGKSRTVAETASYPLLFGSQFHLHLGFIVTLLATFGVWWVLERSTFGFQLRAAGANSNAARTAGINVKKIIGLTMAFAGGLAGLAATAPVLSTSRILTDGVAGSYGFDAITVALLGRATPLGVLLAGLLFGAMQSGASTMQAAAGIPVDIVQVVQAIIVLLVAAAEYIQYRNSKQSPMKVNGKKNARHRVKQNKLETKQSREA